MLSPDVVLWVSRLATAASVLVAAIVLSLFLLRLGGTVRRYYVGLRRRRLLPLVLQAISDPESTPELQQRLWPFDLPILRDILMRLAIDVREEDGTEIVGLISRLGLLEREIRCFRSVRARTRRRAAANLGLLRQAAVVPELLDLLDDRNTNVRLAAIDALGDIACQQGLIPLIPLLGDDDAAVAWRAHEVLSRAGVDVGLQLVRYLSLADDDQAKRAAIDVLRRIRPERAEARLLELLRARSPLLRSQAARSLAALGSDLTGDVLHVMLADSSSRVRLEAVRGLGSVRDPGAVEDLREALQDESRQVRVQALRGLARQGDPGLTALAELMRVEDLPPQPPEPATAGFDLPEQEELAWTRS